MVWPERSVRLLANAISTDLGAQAGSMSSTCRVPGVRSDGSRPVHVTRQMSNGRVTPPFTFARAHVSFPPERKECP